MLMPKRVKFRKMQKGRVRGKACRGNTIAFGDYGLQSLECAWIKAQQIEAARIAISRHVQRIGKLWIRIFPHRSFTKKPAETRMGKGKGTPEGWVAVIQAGTIMFELSGPPHDEAMRALTLAAAKLPVDCRIVTRQEME
jgi:large subunit ribosomal protein L16